MRTEEIYESAEAYVFDLYLLLDSYFQAALAQEGERQIGERAFLLWEKLESGMPRSSLRQKTLWEHGRFTRFERFCILMAGAPHLEPRYGQAFAALLMDPSQTYPTKELLLYLYSMGEEVTEEERGKMMLQDGFYRSYFRRIVPQPEIPLWYRDGLLLEKEAFFAWMYAGELLLGEGLLEEYACRIPCVFSWEDLVVEESVRESLRRICGRIRYEELVGDTWGFYEKRPYGKGVCALFYGPSGTGKTMAAQAVARELSMELYRVDVSQVTSKYIGETQKNISRLFELARGRDVVLFFDEADALFARRTEVKDSHDRHANHESAHLLQQLEDYNGVTILATNLNDNIDEAFKRRIGMMVHFQMPGAKARRELWGRAFPARAPVESLPLDWYAEKFELSGSEIKEAAIQAAFLAADEGEKIGRRHLKEAVRQCYFKYGRILTDADFEDG